MRIAMYLSVVMFGCLLLFPAADVCAQVKDRDKQKEAYKKFAKAVIDKYDTDGNKTLSEEELKSMRRQPPAGTDANSDGEVTLDELWNSYLAKAGLIETKPSKEKSRSRRARGKESPRRARGKDAPRQRSSQRKRGDDKSKSESKSESKSKKGSAGDLLGDRVRVISNKQGMTLVGDPEDVDIVVRALGKMTAEASAEEDGQSKVNGLKKLDIQLWIVKSSDKFGASKVAGQSREATDRFMRAVAAEDDTLVEEFRMTAIEGQRVNCGSRKTVPVVQGLNVGRTGVSTRSISNRDVGTVVEMTPSIHGDMIVLECELAKSLSDVSDVLVGEYKDGSVYADITREFTLETAVACETGKTTVVYSRQDDCCWTLVVSATLAE